MASVCLQSKVEYQTVLPILLLTQANPNSRQVKYVIKLSNMIVNYYGLMCYFICSSAEYIIKDLSCEVENEQKAQPEQTLSHLLT